MAGNMSTQTITFSANRFGSAYAFNDATKELNGQYVKNPSDIVIIETNTDELSNIKITLFKNNQTVELREGVDYEVIHTGGDGQWHMYTYRIFKELFSEDGVYRITVHSEDAAGNVSENTQDTKAANISFGVDNTIPTINIKNVENGATYLLENLLADLSINDNLAMAKLMVYLDGELIAELTGKDLEAIMKNGGNYGFDIANSDNVRELRIVVEDAAGNTFEQTVTDFMVTTNRWIQFYRNKPLFYGSIGGLAALLGFFFFLIGKRKKDEDEEDA
jgi:hypothetical protein